MTRNQVQKIRLTKEERHQVSERAKENGYNTDAQYVREIALGVVRSGPKEMEMRGLIRIANALQSMSLSLKNDRARILAQEVREALHSVKQLVLERHHGNR